MRLNDGRTAALSSNIATALSHEPQLGTGDRTLSPTGWLLEIQCTASLKTTASFTYAPTTEIKLLRRKLVLNCQEVG
jgi:hypothetical protein